MTIAKRCLLCALIVLCLAACSKKDVTTTTNGVTPTRYTVRLLTCDADKGPALEELAREYTDQTGKRVIVETAAAKYYEQMLTAKLSTDTPPTLFQIEAAFTDKIDRCSDLSGAELLEHISDTSLALREDGKVYALPVTSDLTVALNGSVPQEEQQDALLFLRWLCLENADRAREALGQEIPYR